MSRFAGTRLITLATKLPDGIWRLMLERFEIIRFKRKETSSKRIAPKIKGIGILR